MDIGRDLPLLNFPTLGEVIGRSLKDPPTFLRHPPPGGRRINQYSK